MSGTVESKLIKLIDWCERCIWRGDAERLLAIQLPRWITVPQAGVDMFAVSVDPKNVSLFPVYLFSYFSFQFFSLWPVCSSTGFLSLSLADQMSVLQSVWLEVLVLGVAYRSLGCEDEVVFAEDFVLDEEMSRAAGLTELNAAISQLARRFRALNVDREEFVMLKAIALTNSGTCCVVDFYADSLSVVCFMIRPPWNCVLVVLINRSGFSQAFTVESAHLIWNCNMPLLNSEEYY